MVNTFVVFSRYVASRVVESTLAVVRFKKKRKTKEGATEMEEGSEEEQETMGMIYPGMIHGFLTKKNWIYTKQPLYN